MVDNQPAASRLLLVCCGVVLCACVSAKPGVAEQPEIIAGPSVAEVRAAMNRAVRFFGDQVAVEGGYVWEYTKDLRQRWGEGEAKPRQIWVQPPGTPSVGMAFLEAWQRTGDAYCLEAARRAAHALAWGQLSSGGWTYHISFDEATAARYHHRRDVEAGSANPGKRQHTSTFDDDTSQSALRMLMAFDRATEFKDETVQRAIVYALNRILKVQRPNGGWPQRFDGPCDPEKWPVQPARYPEVWSRVHAGESYSQHYTLNDNVVHNLVDTLLLAHEIYGKPRYFDAALRSGDFLILAQLPEPQPTWAQQYNARMEPAWARKFEPPAAVSRESVLVARTLGKLYTRTGDEKYLDPIGPFLDWLQRSRLEDGQYARFYELRSNRPLYCNMDYEIVHTDDDMPAHYSFKSRIDMNALRKWYENLPHQRQSKLSQSAAGPARSAWPPQRLERLRKVLDGLDSDGRWVERNGRIKSSTFIQNLNLLSAWLQ